MTPLLVSCSYGNDSIALIQWLCENLKQQRPCAIVYADTGWSRDGWGERVGRCEAWAQSLGFATHRTHSAGLLEVVRQKKSWPRQGIQFCTQLLKIEPIIALQNILDPERRATVCIGKRRAESANRSNTPEHVESDPYNGGRAVWHPLYLHDDEARDALLQRAGFEPLPHRSDECWPCINANKSDLRRLRQDEARVALIERAERDLGHTGKGAPRVMFHPYRYRGATGIRAMLDWADTQRGGDFDDGTGTDCQYGSAGCGL